MKIKDTFPALTKIAKTVDGSIDVGDIDVVSKIPVIIRVPHTDPSTEKAGIFERQERVCDYVKENSLAKTHPEIARMWCHEKNTIKPTAVSKDATVSVIWERPMITPSGEEGLFLWEETVKSVVARFGKKKKTKTAFSKKAA